MLSEIGLQGRSTTTKKQAGIVIFSCVFDDFVNFADLESGLQGRSTTTKKQVGIVIVLCVFNTFVTFTDLGFCLSFACKEGVRSKKQAAIVILQRVFAI